ALERALAWHLHPIELSDPQEPLQQAALGHAHRELAQGQAGEPAGDIAAQRQDAVAGETRPLLRRRLGPRRGVLRQGELDELLFHATAHQQSVDGYELIAELAELHRSVDARKSWTQTGLIDDGRDGASRRGFVHTNQDA